LLFEPENVESFCEVATRLLGDPALRNRLGDHARKTVIQEKDWSVLAHVYEDVYGFAVDSNNRRRGVAAARK
jgi:glycosyltransferase involved in cell wall biosynthesis